MSIISMLSHKFCFTFNIIIQKTPINNFLPPLRSHHLLSLAPGFFSFLDCFIFIILVPVCRKQHPEIGLALTYTRKLERERERLADGNAPFYTKQCLDHGFARFVDFHSIGTRGRALGTIT